jgi:hypothetical protein
MTSAAELVARLTPLVQRPADRHGGKVVKRLGGTIRRVVLPNAGGRRLASQ